MTDITVVPCTTPHNAQAFAQFDATDAGYPGSAALINGAGPCRAAAGLDECADLIACRFEALGVRAAARAGWLRLTAWPST